MDHNPGCRGDHLDLRWPTFRLEAVTSGGGIRLLGAWPQSLLEAPMGVAWHAGGVAQDRA